MLVVDDHRTFVDLVQHALDAEADLHCAGVAYGVAEALRVSAAVPYAAALVDLGLPDGDGAELVADLHRRTPEARIVVLTAHPRSDPARRAIQAGAASVVSKRGRFDEVLSALRDRTPGRPRAPEEGPLTAREQEVLTLLACGVDVHGIARELTLSSFTVRDHVKSILAKLGARSQLEAVVLASRAGMVLLEPR